MAKKISFIISLLIIFSFGVFALVKAADPPPAKVCGDGIVQTPNTAGQYEQCDDGGETERCTAQCGEKMLGWAWASSLGDFGWLSLNDKNCNGVGCTGNDCSKYIDPNLLAGGKKADDLCQKQTVTYYVQVAASHLDNTTKVSPISGWAWSDHIGWVCFGETCSGLNSQYGTASPASGWQAYAQDDGTDNPLVKGWAKIIALGDGGWISLGCANDIASCAQSDYQVRLVKGDFNGEKRFTLKAMAWNGNNDGSGTGFLGFSPGTTESPWLQTKYGDIYAGGGISGSAPPPYSYNATYQILANGNIVNFSSQKGSVNSNFPAISFPTAQSGYANVLGKLDLNGLLCQPGTDNTCVNKYGKTVVKITDQAGLPQSLNGKIYHAAGNLTISNPIVFNNGANFENGSGTIIVDGNLIINSNITYTLSDNLTKFKNLASVAWIVKGDLQISGSVAKLAGNFIVLGSGGTGGQVSSCLPAVNCSNQLVVSGLVIAKQFSFTRTAVSQFEGSEVIIYDGRLLANTPPGLDDFAKALPIWRSGTFAP